MIKPVPLTAAQKTVVGLKTQRVKKISDFFFT